jgi:dephospho-CoA kinase
MPGKRIIEIGLTGGIGSGKSWAARLFPFWGIPVYESDPAAKQLYLEPGIREQVLELFGKEAYPDGLSPDTRFLAAAIYRHAVLREKLNAILHPAVGLAYQNWLSRQKAPYAVKVAALLFEAGIAPALDATILVSAPDSLRIRRIQERDPFRTGSEIEAIMASQWPEEKKAALADYHILNDEAHSLIAQVESLDDLIRKRFIN